jgi:hypothetical protein
MERILPAITGIGFTKPPNHAIIPKLEPADSHP